MKIEKGTRVDAKKPYHKPHWEKQELFERFSLACTKYTPSPRKPECCRSTQKNS